jgi:hypothetical protein
VQVAAADGGAHHADDRIGRVLDDGVGHGLDADVSGSVQQGGSHGFNLLQVISDGIRSRLLEVSPCGRG